jgi:inositol polyphosphate 5-phosphatase INPP5B/F
MTIQGITHFEFHDLEQSKDLNQKDFIFIRPQHGSLIPTEKISIDITILVGNKTIPQVAKGRPLDEILILEIRNGRHIFISLQGEFQRTCFGMPIEFLASLGGKGVRNVNLDDGEQRYSGGGMPDELWRMTDFIMNFGKDCGSLFLERGDEIICKVIRECLDTSKEFDAKLISEGEIGVLSMAETLLRFLEALPTSIIPMSLYEKVIRIGENRGSSAEVFSGVARLMIGDGYFTRNTCQCVDIFDVIHATDI